MKTLISRNVMRLFIFTYANVNVVISHQVGVYLYVCLCKCCYISSGRCLSLRMLM